MKNQLTALIVQKLKEENAQLLQQVEFLSSQLNLIQYGGTPVPSSNNDGYYIRGLFYPYEHLNDFSNSSTSFDSDSEQSKMSNQNILDSEESENGLSDSSLQVVSVISSNSNTLYNEINKRQSEEKKEKQGEEQKNSDFLENQQN